MFASKVRLVLAFAALMSLPGARPDSAGIVEMEDGLAYGGIPYGSVTGMVGKQHPGFGGTHLGPAAALEPRPLRVLNAARPVIVTPNFRASGRILGARPRAVQIYNLPGVVAPGVVGRISQIGY